MPAFIMPITDHNTKTTILFLAVYFNFNGFFILSKHFIGRQRNTETRHKRTPQNAISTANTDTITNYTPRTTATGRHRATNGDTINAPSQRKSRPIRADFYIFIYLFVFQSGETVGNSVARQSVWAIEWADKM